MTPSMQPSHGAGIDEDRSAAVGGFRALTRLARCQARLLQPHQMVALLEALAAGAAAVTGGTAGALQLDPGARAWGIVSVRAGLLRDPNPPQRYPGGA